MAVNLTPALSFGTTNVIPIKPSKSDARVINFTGNDEFINKNMKEALDTSAHTKLKSFFPTLGRNIRKAFYGGVAATAIGTATLSSCKPDEPIFEQKVLTTGELEENLIDEVFGTSEKSAKIAPRDTAFFESSEGGGLGLKFKQINPDGSREYWTTFVRGNGTKGDVGKIVTHAETAADGVTQNLAVDYFFSTNREYKSEANLTDGITYKFKKVLSEPGTVSLSDPYAPDITKYVKESYLVAKAIKRSGKLTRVFLR